MKRMQLYGLIRDVGLHYGEPLESLREYAKDIVQMNMHDLDAAIKCFEDLLNRQGNRNGQAIKSC